MAMVSPSYQRPAARQPKQGASSCAYSRRVGNSDVEALALMLGLAEEIDTAIAEAAKGLRTCGYSRAEIRSRLGITRQAARQRWRQR